MLGLSESCVNDRMRVSVIETVTPVLVKNLKCLRKDKRIEVWQELQFLLENSDQFDHDKHTPEKVPRKKMQKDRLLSDCHQTLKVSHRYLSPSP